MGGEGKIQTLNQLALKLLYPDFLLWIVSSRQDFLNFTFARPLFAANEISPTRVSSFEKFDKLFV